MLQYPMFGVLILNGFQSDSPENHLHGVVLCTRTKVGDLSVHCFYSMLSWALSACRGFSSACIRRRRPPDMEGNCKCIK